jgi:hypothetical protein
MMNATGKGLRSSLSFDIHHCMFGYPLGVRHLFRCFLFGQGFVGPASVRPGIVPSLKP